MIEAALVVLVACGLVAVLVVAVTLWLYWSPENDQIT